MDGRTSFFYVIENGLGSSDRQQTLVQVPPNCQLPCCVDWCENNRFTPGVPRGCGDNWRDRHADLVPQLHLYVVEGRPLKTRFFILHCYAINGLVYLVLKNSILSQNRMAQCC